MNIRDLKEEKWNKRFLEVAALVATWSKDRSTHVGAVIVDQHRRILSTGYNGFPRGVNDDDAARHERPEKYLWTEHAERNAIYAAAAHGVALGGCILYCTHPPCADCARGIVQSGIRSVIFNEQPIRGWEANWAVSQELLLEGGVGIHSM